MTIWHHPSPGDVVMEGDFPAQHWVLQLIGDYSTLQSTIEMVIDRKLFLGSPAVGRIIQKKFLNRVKDVERWDLVKALATDAQYDGDMRVPSDLFWEAKRVRDLFAHHTGLPLVRTTKDPTFFYLVLGNPSARDKIPSPLTPAVVRQLSANCRWLRALVEHLGSLAGIPFASFVVRERTDGSVYLPTIEVLPPPLLPIPPDWEPGNLTRETGGSSIPVQQPAAHKRRMKNRVGTY